MWRKSIAVFICKDFQILLYMLCISSLYALYLFRFSVI